MSATAQDFHTITLTVSDDLYQRPVAKVGPLGLTAGAVKALREYVERPERAKRQSCT